MMGSAQWAAQRHADLDSEKGCTYILHNAIQLRSEQNVKLLLTSLPPTQTPPDSDSVDWIWTLIFRFALNLLSWQSCWSIQELRTELWPHCASCALASPCSCHSFADSPCALSILGHLSSLPGYVSNNSSSLPFSLLPHTGLTFWTRFSLYPKVTFMPSLSQPRDPHQHIFRIICSNLLFSSPPAQRLIFNDRLHSLASRSTILHFSYPCAYVICRHISFQFA